MTIGSEQHLDLSNNNNRNENQHARLDVHHCWPCIPASCGYYHDWDRIKEIAMDAASGVSSRLFFHHLTTIVSALFIQ